MNRPEKSPARGFTLIELLVVVAIIALLIAILLPSLSAARDKAKAAACLANLKAITQAGVMYISQDNNDFIMEQNTSLAGAFWMYFTQKYLGANNVKGLRGGATTFSGNVFFCPSANQIAPNGITNPGGGSSTIWGDVFHAWNADVDTGWWDRAILPDRDGASGASVNNPEAFLDLSGNPLAAGPTNGGTNVGYKSSYGINSYMDYRYPIGNRPNSTGLKTNGPYTAPPGYTNMSKFSSIAASTTPFFFDAIWAENDKGTYYGIAYTGSSPQNSIFVSASNSPPSTTATGDAGSGEGRIAIARHGKGINVAYADGSARAMLLRDIYKQNWYMGCQQGPIVNPTDISKISSGR